MCKVAGIPHGVCGCSVPVLFIQLLTLDVFHSIFCQCRTRSSQEIDRPFFFPLPACAAIAVWQSILGYLIQFQAALGLDCMLVVGSPKSKKTPARRRPPHQTQVLIGFMVKAWGRKGRAGGCDGDGHTRRVGASQAPPHASKVRVV